MSKRFAGKFIAMAREVLPKNTPIPRTPKKWRSFVKPSINGGDRVLNYLARYVFRHAITNGRILSIDHGRIRFRYQNSQTQQWATMELEAEEFIRRFLQHVLPTRFHKIRYFGLWHPRRRDKLQRLIDLNSGNSSLLQATAEEKPPPTLECLQCGCDHLRFIGRLPRYHLQLADILHARPPPPLVKKAA